MYRDRKKKPLRSFLYILCIVLILAGIGYAGRGNTSRDMDEESLLSVKSAIQRSALQCYVVEGVYPPDLAYLQENYGLQVNTDDFYVVYDAFAENLPPDVIVSRKK